jgi:6-phosphogluconate dehydrogenase
VDIFAYLLVSATTKGAHSQTVFNDIFYGAMLIISPVMGFIKSNFTLKSHELHLI